MRVPEEISPFLLDNALSKMPFLTPTSILRSVAAVKMSVYRLHSFL